MYNGSRFTPQDMGTENETALSFSKQVKSGYESTVGENALCPCVHSQTKCVKAGALGIQPPLASLFGVGRATAAWVCPIVENPKTPTLPLLMLSFALQLKAPIRTATPLGWLGGISFA